VQAVHPTGYLLHGHYRVQGLACDLFAPPANTYLLAMRWADPHRFCILERLSVIVSVKTAITAQRLDPLIATFQRQYTVGESGGGAVSILPTGVSGRAFLGMPGPTLAQLVIAGGSTAFINGTRVADSSPFGHDPLTGLGAIGSGVSGDFIDYGRHEQFPIIFSLNEGLTVQWPAQALATGQANISFCVEWAEVSN